MKIKTGMELVDGLQKLLERLPRMQRGGIVAGLEGLRSDASDRPFFFSGLKYKIRRFIIRINT